MIRPRPLGGAVLRAARALADPLTPVQVQLVVTRRCNLSCAYCNEYDDHSPPVDLDRLRAYVDRLGDLGTVVLTFTGGEPFLHPGLDELCAHAVERGMVVTAITNGYALKTDWIARMNRAGLTLLQISIDNLEPSRTSRKSLSRLRPRLELLRREAEFEVNVNTVLGACTADESRRVVREITGLGFYQTVQLLHDGEGQVDPGLVGRDGLAELYAELRTLSRKSPLHHVGEGWEERMVETGRAEWKCRAGARYLYVDEHGLVSYCSQRRGSPGIPLLAYTRGDLERAWSAPKACAARCTIGCVRRASAVDRWRAQDGPVELTRPPRAARRAARSLPVVAHRGSSPRFRSTLAARRPGTGAGSRPDPRASS